MSSCIRSSQSELAKKEPGLQSALGPPSVSLNPQVAGADCGLRFRSGSGATLGGVDTTCRGNSKSLANLLCAYALPDDARARTVRRFECYADFARVARDIGNPLNSARVITAITHMYVRRKAIDGHSSQWASGNTSLATIEQ